MGDLKGSHLDSIAWSNPINLIGNGVYSYGSGSFDSRSAYGYLYESSPDSATNAKYFGFSSTRLYPQNSLNKGYGMILRCLVC